MQTHSRKFGSCRDYTVHCCLHVQDPFVVPGDASAVNGIIGVSYKTYEPTFVLVTGVTVSRHRVLNSPIRTDTKRRNTLDSTGVGNPSVIGNRRGMWPFWNWGDISLSLESWETAQTKKPRKYHTETRSLNVISPLQNKGNMPKK